MKILFIHTYYQQPSGEDTVFHQEMALLSQTENTEALTFHNKKGWIGALQFMLLVWNIFAAKKIRSKIRQYQPDIIHIHNWHYAIGPIVFRVAKKAGIPLVHTLHNYRLLCPSATLLYNKQLFTDSIKATFPWKAIFKKVYRNSFFKTFWLAFSVWFHKKIGTWKMIDKYIVLTESAKNLFVHSSLGIPGQKIIVKPNFVKRNGQISGKRKNHFMFIGRLSEEKGIHVLLEAFTNSNYELHIAGSGPLKEKVLEVCTTSSNIKYIGNLNKDDVVIAMNSCTALIFPSIWYEPFGLVIIEAFSSGCPLLASNIGSPAELVQHGINGFHFEAGNATALNKQLHHWQNLSEPEKEKIRYNSFSTYKKFYTPEKNKEQLIEIYKSLNSNHHF